VVTAVGDGETEIQCAAGPFTDSRAVRVRAEVARITLTPAPVALEPGGTQQFAATLRDPRDNVISGRSVAWTSSDDAVATVTQAGIATAVAAGSARIDATSGGVTGSATLVVIQPPPTVMTAPASDVAASSAVLNGSVNPNGSFAVAWFEWGTSASLASFTSTPQQEIGSGSTVQPARQLLEDLVSNVTHYYRVAASNEGGEVRGEIVSFTPSLPPDVVTGEASAAERSAVLTGTVTPNGLATEYWFEWAADPGLEESSSTPMTSVGAGREGVTVRAELTRLTPGTTYYFRGVARSEAGTTAGEVEAFRTVPASPTVTTSPASDVAASSAVLNGAVNPNGSFAVAWFEWSSDPSLVEYITTPRREVGSGSTAEPVSELLVELAPNVTVYFRAAASNEVGTARGEVLSFTPLLPPDAVTDTAFVGAESVLLTGDINPNGLPTVYWFEWGTDPGLEPFTRTPDNGIDAVRVPVNVRWQLSALAPGMTYYYRVVAGSEAGTTEGGIKSFRTAPVCIPVAPCVGV
ncbi:MAG: Ig-like domain-containing protein, partial [Longimicrobiales bacterium]